MLRPPHVKASALPYKTSTSMLVDVPVCTVCRAKQLGVKPRGHHETISLKRTPAQEEELIARMRVEIDWLVRDRRARNVPPEGVPMPGEVQFMDRQRPMPGRAS